MPEKRIVVFTTTTIKRFTRSTPDETPKATVESEEIFSTGVLEKALSEGWDVYVVTTQSTLGDHDRWWLSLIPDGHAFLTPSAPELEQKPGSENRLLEPWKQLFQHLGIPFPEGKYEWVDEVQRDLPTYGIAWGPVRFPRKD